MHLIESIELAVLPAQVFEYLATHSNHVHFVKENVSCKQITPGPMQVGTRVTNVAVAFGRRMTEHFAVTEFEPNRKLAKASVAGSYETTDSFTLEATAAGTRLVFEVTVQPRSLGERLIVWAMTPVIRRSMCRSLNVLKQLLEAPVLAHCSIEAV